MANIEDKAINLLCRGISQVDVAKACGVDESRISQLMGDEEFKAKLIDAKFKKYGEQARMDETYDSMEAKLQQRFEALIPMIHKPKDVLDAMQKLNAMKRRSGIIDADQNKINEVATLTVPIAIINKYNIVVDQSTNRVIEANGQPLLTAQPNQVVDANEIRSKIKGRTVGAIDL